MISWLRRIREILQRPVKLDWFRRLSLTEPLASSSSVALLFATLLIVLHVGTDRTAWNFAEVPASFRWTVLCVATWQSLPIMVLLGVAVQGTRSTLGLIRWASLLLIACVLYAWLGSWAVFAGTGQFLNRESVVLALASPRSMLDHIWYAAPARLALVPVAAVVLSLLFRAAAHAVVLSRPLFQYTCVAALAVVLTGARFVDSTMTGRYVRDHAIVAHPDGGDRIRMYELFRLGTEDHGSPLSHLRAEFARERWVAHESPAVEVTWPKRIEPRIPEPERKLSVIILLVESLRSDELRAYGAELDVMPAVNALAGESIVWLDHYAVATHSNYASVAPVSSQYPLRVEATHIYPSSPPYPRVHLYDVLKPHGYRTAIVSSQNETWGGMHNFLQSPNLDYFLHSETYDGETYVDARDVGFASFVAENGVAGKIDDRNTIDEAIEWIATGDPSQPFMMYINLQNSHVPYPIPASAPTPFGPRKPSFVIGFNSFPRDSAEVVRGVYRNALYYVDAQIARLIQFLKASDRWQETIVVLAGDHGQAFFEHGFAAHGNALYEELLRTPLLIRVPGMQPAIRRGLAQHVDIAPTVLDILGVPAQPFFQGRSLLDEPRQYAYVLVQTSMANQYGIVSDSVKLIVDVRRRHVQLHDLESDPMERGDETENRRAIASLLRERLDTWRAVQLRYYGTTSMQSMFFAPVLPE